MILQEEAKRSRKRIINQATIGARRSKDQRVDRRKKKGGRNEKARAAVSIPPWKEWERKRATKVTNKQKKGGRPNELKMGEGQRNGKTREKADRFSPYSEGRSCGSPANRHA